MYDEGLSKYSIALYEVQEASGEDMLDKLDDVREVYKDKTFLMALSHPKIRPEQKHALIKKCLATHCPSPCLICSTSWPITAARIAWYAF